MTFVHFFIFLSCLHTASFKSISIQIETDDVTQVLSNIKASMSKLQDADMSGKILDQIFQILSAEDQPFFNPYHPEDQSKYRRAKAEKFRSLIRRTTNQNIEKANEKYIANGLNKISEDELTENLDEERKLRAQRENQIKRAEPVKLISKRRSDALMDFDNDRYFLTGLNKISDDELTENHEDQIPKSVKKEKESFKKAKQERFKIKNTGNDVAVRTEDRLFSTDLKISKDDNFDKPEKKNILTTETENNRKERGKIKRRANNEFATDPNKFSETRVLKNPQEIVHSTTETKVDPLVNLSQSEADAIEDLYLITQDNIGKKRFNDMKKEGIIYT